MMTMYNESNQVHFSMKWKPVAATTMMVISAASADHSSRKRLADSRV